jgi:hypothetical protein
MKYRASIITAVVFVYVAASAVTINATELKNLIPSSNEIAGFKISKKPEYYNQENLWDYMNGGAPGYLAYGFKEMVTFGVMNLKNSLEYVIDVYDMGSSLNAFGIYSTERLPSGRDAECGVDSFQSDKILFFWQDSYYVKIMVYGLTSEKAKSLNFLAQVIAQKIPKKGTRPHLLSIFPEKGKFKKSERYIRRDVLGQEYFTNGYSAEYEKNASKYQIFLICADSLEETRQDFQKYRNYLKTVGSITDERMQLGEQAFVGTHNYYGMVLFARRGASIIGILGLDDRQAAQKIIKLMISRLAEIKNII